MHGGKSRACTENEGRTTIMTANDIRNIALLGHGGSGKTSLAEQMLFMTKGTDRLGKTADGNTTCDYDAEEIKRQISISLAFAPVNYKGVKINVMDAPGNFDFSGEALSAIRAAECAVLVGAAVMTNSAFIGIPLISALLGSEAGALYGAAGIMAYNILFFTYVQHLFDPEAKVSIKAFLTPTNITTAIMVVMLVTGLRLPAILDSFCKAVGNTTTPLALIIAGCMLARSDLKKLVTNPMVWLITALRCVVFPLGFLAALYFLPLDRTLCMAILILASCTAGSLTAVLAKQYDTEGELASQAVAHSTLSILISVPLVLSLGSTLLGI